MKQYALLFIMILSCVPSVWSQKKWIDPTTADQTVIGGKGWNKKECGLYNRLPQKAQEKVRKPLWNLSCQTAGLYINFTTNSPEITINYQVSGGFSMNHMSATGVSGVDLYVTTPKNKQVWCSPTHYSFGKTCTYTYKKLNNEEEGRNFQLFLPLYNSVKNLQIGVDEQYNLEFSSLDDRNPIVAYGTSICQGACASRPGMAWTTILQRKLEYPVVNLGFSGNGRLEEPLFELMASVPAKLYIIDCMPNMWRDNVLPLVYDRTIKGVKMLREHSDAPILLVEHDGYMGDQASEDRYNCYNKSNIELKRAYKQIQKENIKKVYYLSKEELGLTMDSQVDGTHASNLGMQQYADAYERKIRNILPLSELKSTSKSDLKPALKSVSTSASNWEQDLKEKKFKYSKIKGIGYEKGCTRRDPSDIIKVGDTYYIYYTKVYGKAAGYWGTIWCASSQDEGHTWTELGEVLSTGKKGTFDSFAVFTPNIIYAKGAYYMYYTGVRPTHGKEIENLFENNSLNDYTALGVAKSTTPEGPFIRCNNEPILSASTDFNAFDSYRLDDASVVFKANKYWLYYKGRCILNGVNGPANTHMGVAFSKSPQGPFIKKGQSILDKGHEVMIWPYGKKIYALASFSSTLECANDGIDFMSNPIHLKVKNRPNAPGMYRPDLTNPKENTTGLNWGISMIFNGEECYLIRYTFDN